MTVTMTAAEWIGVISSFLFAIAVLLVSVGRLLIAQIDKRLDARFDALEAQRRDRQEAWQALFAEHIKRLDARFDALEAQRRDRQEAWQALFAEHIRHDERELGAVNATLSALSANLSGHYVRKDEVRGIVGKDLEDKFDRIISAINESKNR